MYTFTKFWNFIDLIFCKEMYEPFLFWLFKPSAFKYFHFPWKNYEILANRHRTTNSHSNNPSESENDDNNNHTENKTESLQGETSVEPNRNPTENTRQNSLQIPESSFSEILTRQVQNPILWIFIIRVDSRWDWTFTITTLTKNRSCKSIITKKRTETWSIDTTN